MVKFIKNVVRILDNLRISIILNLRFSWRWPSDPGSKEDIDDSKE